jgi:NAD(P)-dependent dehydrogenase (short-subunit alcohol dehydrogenase family)
MIDLNGHHALVTGSSKGVGRALALACAEAGADVLVHGRQHSDEAAAVISACREAGVTSDFVGSDLSGPTEAAVDTLFDATIAADPDVDILINNAGQFFDLPFLDMTHERFDRTFRLNVGSVYFLTQRWWARSTVDSQSRGRPRTTRRKAPWT